MGTPWWKLYFQAIYVISLKNKANIYAYKCQKISGKATCYNYGDL